MRARMHHSTHVTLHRGHRNRLSPGLLPAHRVTRSQACDLIPDLPAYNAMLMAYGTARQYPKVKQLWIEMQQKGVKGNAHTHKLLRSIFSRLGDRQQVCLSWTTTHQLRPSFTAPTAPRRTTLHCPLVPLPSLIWAPSCS